jgi:hypothetical protein
MPMVVTTAKPLMPASYHTLGESLPRYSMQHMQARYSMLYVSPLFNAISASPLFHAVYLIF